MYILKVILLKYILLYEKMLKVKCHNQKAGGIANVNT